jgi:KUP system potassium uptake protein
MTAENAPHGEKSGLAATALAAMGVVFGDIGTSPLYTVKEVFGGHHPLAVTPRTCWVSSRWFSGHLTITVSLKYVVFIMRADNKGEGGIMALTALALRTANASPRVLWLMSALGIFGAALFYGDAVITPAMSVLSAVEGLEVATPLLKPYVLPITVAILVVLFFFQRHGTAAVGALFGPLMMFWFATLGALGLWNVIQYPSVLAAINPWYALAFCHRTSGHGLSGARFGGAGDHRRRSALRRHGPFRPPRDQVGLVFFVFPLLYLNYLGQGALILNDPKAIESPFFLMAPSEILLIPLVILATVATVIASQAVISGAFSLTSQAMQLGYCPRIRVKFTSEREKGQIYVPNINWLLLLTVIIVVLGFRSSSNLASAYGIAVTLTMMIDTILAFVVVRALWKWSWPHAALFLVFFVVVDFAFLLGQCDQDPRWRLVPAGAGFRGVCAALHLAARSQTALRKAAEGFGPARRLHCQSRCRRTAPRRWHRDFPDRRADGVPRALLHNLYHNKVLHERVVLLNVVDRGRAACPRWRARARRSAAGGISSGVRPLRLQG